MTLNIEHITFDCHDAQALANFWSAATGHAIEDDWGDFVRLAEGQGGIRLCFQAVPEDKVAKNRMHRHQLGRYDRRGGQSCRPRGNGRGRAFEPQCHMDSDAGS